MQTNTIKEILDAAGGDYYTAHGAGCLAKAIETYWHARGHRNVKAERYELSPGTWGVRSNLVAGLPPAPEKRVPRVLGVYKL